MADPVEEMPSPAGPTLPGGGGRPPTLAPGVWPRTLPLPDMSGYSWVTQFGAQTAPEPGSGLQRRNYFGQPTQITFAFRFTTQQLGEFHLFLQGYGFSFFSMELVLAGARIKDPARDCVTAKVRFTSDPVVNMTGINAWAVSITGEIRSMLNPGGAT